MEGLHKVNPRRSVGPDAKGPCHSAHGVYSTGVGGARADSFGATSMPQIEITGVAGRETRGMKTRVVFQLNFAPSEVWLKTFDHVTNIQVSSYPREMFRFDGNTVACEFLGPREPEVLETLRLYVADTNKQVEKIVAARRAATNPKLAREQIEAKKRQTLMLNRELFGDEPDAEE